MKRSNNFHVVQASTPKQSNSMAVGEDGSDLSYFGVFQFGSSSKNFYMLFDTAGTNSWVMASSCTTQACNMHTTLGSSDSSSLQVKDPTLVQ